MAMVPENPVVGGTVLRRAAIRSPNFVSGSTGWSINQDGSAEFNNIVIRNGQIISGAALYYFPSPGLGNLVASIAGTDGTDSFGQPYLHGVTSYSIVGNISGQAVNLHNGIITYWSSAGQGQPWNAGAATAGDAAGDLVLTPLTGQAILCQALLNAQTGLSWTGDAAGDRLTLTRSGGAPLLQVTNLANASTVCVRVTVPFGAGVQQECYAILQSGLTQPSLSLDIDAGGLPRLKMGPGNTSPDTHLFRVSAGVFGVDNLVFQITAGQGEAWNLVTTFSNSWGNAANGPPMQYKRIPSPDNSVNLVGRLLAPAGIAGNQTVFTLPAGYCPNTLQGFIGVNVSTGAIVRFTVTGSTGVIQYQSGAAAGNTIDIPAGTLLSLLA